MDAKHGQSQYTTDTRIEAFVDKSDRKIIASYHPVKAGPRGPTSLKKNAPILLAQ